MVNKRALATASIAVGAMISWLATASAHDWYPVECCNGGDCEPVESVMRIYPPGGGMPQLLVTTKRGSTLLPANFPVRQSKDSRMHICVRGTEYGRDDVKCFFMPPSM